ncbi:MAG: phosphate ABC transporter permease PstA [Thermaerobacter sp.]|nr:phosphate ABC transporter permease PstA [Thermaerobacter sp.]
MTWRYIKDRLMLILASALGLILVIPIVGMIWLVVSRALPALNFQLFTQVTVGTGGGLANAIVGTFYIVGLGLLIAAPLGIAAGVFLGEIAPTSRFSAMVRFTTDVLAGVPSIVIGYFGYVTMVLGLGWGFSTLAGAIALALIGIPYVVRSTEIALSKVPRGMREASMALGANLTTTVWRVSLRSAAPGVLTGVLLALSLAIGETAPLLYTAGWSSYMPSFALTHSPIGYLTYVVWTFINEPFASANALAYAAGFLLLVFIVLVNVIARSLIKRATVHS